MLTAEERAGIEAWRSALGLRSEADVIRYWARQLPPPSRAKREAFAQSMSEAVETLELDRPGALIPEDAGARINRIGAASGLQLGPTPSAPGKRLKPDKGPKR